MSQEVLFRSALGGYNKDDVNKFIEQQNEEFTAQIKRLEEELNSAKKQLESQSEKSAADQNRILQLESDNRALKASEEKLLAECADLKGEIERLNCTIETIQSENKRLSEKLDDILPKYEDSAVKVKKYNEIKDNITNILVDAHRYADMTLLEANAKAKEIEDNKRQMIEGFRDSIDRFRVNASEPIAMFDRLIKDIKESIADFENAFLQLEGSFAEQFGEKDDVQENQAAPAQEDSKPGAVLSFKSDAERDFAATLPFESEKVVGNGPFH